MVNVFIDKSCNREVVSDAYRQLPPFEMEELHDVAFEVKCRYMNKGQEDFGISHNQDEDAEGAGGDAGGESGGERILDVVDSFSLVESPMDGKVFQQYFANYMKNVLLPTIPDENKTSWKASMQKLYGQIKSKLADGTFYFSSGTAEMDDPSQAHPIFGYWVGEEEAPRLIFIKDGLKEVKY